MDSKKEIQSDVSSSYCMLKGLLDIHCLSAHILLPCLHHDSPAAVMCMWTPESDASPLEQCNYRRRPLCHDVGVPTRSRDGRETACFNAILFQVLSCFESDKERRGAVERRLPGVPGTLPRSEPISTPRCQRLEILGESHAVHRHTTFYLPLRDLHHPSRKAFQTRTWQTHA